MNNLISILNKYKYIVIILFCGIFMFIQNVKINKLDDIRQLQGVELLTLKDSVQVVKSKNGELTYKVTATEIEKANLKEALNTLQYDLKDFKNREIKWRNINHALELKLSSQGTGTTVLHDTVFINNGDTTKGSTYEWNNKFLFINGKIIGKEMGINYRYETDMKLIDEKVGKSTVVSVYTTDSCAVISGIKPLIITSKKHFWEKPWITIPIGILVGGILIK